jgi:hypothetical protein
VFWEIRSQVNNLRYLLRFIFVAFLTARERMSKMQLQQKFIRDHLMMLAGE